MSEHISDTNQYNSLSSHASAARCSNAHVLILAGPAIILIGPAYHKAVSSKMSMVVKPSGEYKPLWFAAGCQRQQGPQ